MRNRAARRGRTTAAVPTTRGISRSNQINKSNAEPARAWPGPIRRRTPSRTSSIRSSSTTSSTCWRRNNSLVALDATTGREIWIHEGLQGIAPRGINYWESKDRSDRRLLFQMNSYLQAIDARTGKSITTFGKDGAVNLREGLGRDPATIVKTQSSNPGQGVREPHHPRIGGGRKLHGARRRSSRVRRRDRRARLAVPHHSASGRVRLRDVAAGCVEVHRRRQHLGRDHGRSRQRHRLFSARIADLRLLRRRSARRKPVRHVAARAERTHGKAAVALPDGAPRSVGLRQRRGAAVDDRAPQRQDDRRRRAGRQDRISVRVRSRHGRAAVAHRRAARAAERDSRRSARGRRSRFRPRRRRSRRRGSRPTTSIRTS